MHVTTSVRAALAVTLLAGFYLIGIGLLAGLALLSGWLWLVDPGPLAQEVSFVAAATAVGLVVPMWRLLRTRPEPPEGAPVSEQQAPYLWSQARELATAAGTRPPDEIRLSFAANAWVWEDTSLLGLRPGRRYLYLGVPMLQTMTVAQLRAVLAHELGHYSHHHTRLGALTYRGGMAIVHTIMRAGPRSVAGLVLAGYAAVYFLVSLAVMRRMELEADQIAVRVAGREATALALHDASRLDRAWQTYLAGYVTWARTEPYTRVELLSRFPGWIRDRWPKVEHTQSRTGGTGSRWDSHPPVAERVARLADHPDPPVVPEPRPGTVLVDDAGAMAEALNASAFDHLLEQLAQHEAQTQAEWLYAVTAHLRRSRSCVLGCVLDLLVEGRRAELRRAAELQPEELVDVVNTAAAATLVTSGVARWRHAPPALLAPVTVEDDEPVDLRPAIALACRDVTGVEQLRSTLRKLGADEAQIAGNHRARAEELAAGELLQELPGQGLTNVRALLLPDELFLLTHSQDRYRLSPDVLHAALAAASLAELRLRGHVEVSETDAATVVVCRPAPTGDPFLDSVLDRVAASEDLPAYQLLQALGPEVASALLRRLNRPGSAGWWHRQASDIDARTRYDVRQAVRAGEVDGRALAFGALLWGTELAGPVLGRTALITRFWLGRAAARDRLAVAIRVVIGLHMPLPSGGGAGGSG